MWTNNKEIMLMEVVPEVNTALTVPLQTEPQIDTDLVKEYSTATLLPQQPISVLIVLYSGYRTSS